MINFLNEFTSNNYLLDPKKVDEEYPEEVRKDCTPRIMNNVEKIFTFN